MVEDTLPCAVGQFTDDALSSLNRSPLAFLASCGVRHGESFGRAFLHAQAAIDRHGTSRRIERGQAIKLCHTMRRWAEEGAQRPSPPPS